MYEYSSIVKTRSQYRRYVEYSRYFLAINISNRSPIIVQKRRSSETSISYQYNRSPILCGDRLGQHGRTICRHLLFRSQLADRRIATWMLLGW